LENEWGWKASKAITRFYLFMEDDVMSWRQGKGFN